MKTAREMFEELGYILIVDNEIGLKFTGEFGSVIFIKKPQLIKVCDVNGNGCFVVKELQAINQMVKELGWLDE